MTASRARVGPGRRRAGCRGLMQIVLWLHHISSPHADHPPPGRRTPWATRSSSASWVNDGGPCISPVTEMVSPPCCHWMVCAVPLRDSYRPPCRPPTATEPAGVPLGCAESCGSCTTLKNQSVSGLWKVCCQPAAAAPNAGHDVLALKARRHVCDLDELRHLPDRPRLVTYAVEHVPVSQRCLQGDLEPLWHHHRGARGGRGRGRAWFGLEADDDGVVRLGQLHREVLLARPVARRRRADGDLQRPFVLPQHPVVPPRVLVDGQRGALSNGAGLVAAGARGREHEQRCQPGRDLPASGEPRGVGHGWGSGGRGGQ